MKHLALAQAVLLGSFSMGLAAAEPADSPCKDKAVQALRDASTDGKKTAVVVVKMDHPEQPYYVSREGNCQAGIPSSLPNFRKDSVSFVVLGVNPLTQSCTLGFQDTPTAEPTASGIASFIGITIPGGAGKQDTGSGAEASALPASIAKKAVADQYSLAVEQPSMEKSLKAASIKTCTDRFNAQIDDANTKIKAANSFTDAVTAKVNEAQAEVTKYNQLVVKANLATLDGWSAIRKTANDYTQEIPPPTPAFDSQDLAKDSFKIVGLPPAVTSVLSELKSKDFASAATELAGVIQQANLALKPADECKGEGNVPQRLKQEQELLSAFYSDSGGKPAKEAAWKDQLASIGKISSALTTALADMQDKLGKTEAMTIEKSVPDVNQTTDVATLSCTTQPSPLVKIQLSGEGANAGSGGGNKQAAAGDGTGSADQNGANTKKTSAAAETHTFTLRFGYGPHIYESAGVVFSPLKQHSYATAAAGSSVNCPSTIPGSSNAATGCIVDSGTSDWRILPVAIVSYRLIDSESDVLRALTPYASFGATVKSSTSSGTSVEYLLGGSWAIPHRYLFLTAGAYAGQVTHLGGGLTVGPQTGTVPSTLPTTTGYEWGFGFAVTFKVGSQQNNSQTSTKK